MGTHLRLSIVILFIALAGLLVAPRPAQAQWPPFVFRLTPTFAEGRITYDVLFVKQFEGALTDITIKVPLPAGTRYLSSITQANTVASFDGREVTFFSAVLDRNAIRVASFTVEPTDPAQTVFTTQPWLSWKGDMPGDFLANEVTIDISKPVLDWSRPLQSWLRLEATAITGGNVLTYTLYPTNAVTRMWDATIKLPLPAQTTFITAEPSHPFVASFDGREVTFFASELSKDDIERPLQVVVSTQAVTTPLAVTHAWATWRNVGPAVGRTIPEQQDTRTGDIVVQPGGGQWLVADVIGDVPFAGYDVTSLAITNRAETLDVDYFIVGDISGLPLVFLLNINTDCAGQPEYQAIYNQDANSSQFRAWDAIENKWGGALPLGVTNSGPHWVTLSIQKALFAEPQHSQDFCVQGLVQNRDTTYSTPLPGDNIPNAANGTPAHYRALSVQPQATGSLDLPENPAPLEGVPDYAQAYPAAP